MYNKAVLVITDGIGHNKESKFNAFYNAKKSAYDYLFKNAAHSLIATSGKAVGLPDGQMGNSEVGHMSIGSGRLIYQNLVKIDNAILDGSFAKNRALKKLIANSNRIHIIGLYSDGGVHSHLTHFNKAIESIKSANKEVIIHAITDGRDVLPDSALAFIKELESKFQIASILGRFYAMDRDKRWERVQEAYEVIVNGANLKEIAPSEYIKESYKSGVFDEFIKPASFYDFGGVKKNDGVLFINFRNDRMKEIVSAFGCADFDGFKQKEIFKNIATMTTYDDTFGFDVLFEKEEIKETLAETIASVGLSQLHTAETEKYAHVTFFLNGGKEEPCINETRVLVPSPKVKTYDQKPQMSAFEVCDVVLKGMDGGEDFIVVNFANGDMVGHTGNYEASIKAVEAVDKCLGKIIAKAKELGYAYIQTSDHGNCEAMRDESGNILTNHTTFDVYCFVLADGVKSIKNGRLSNIAPTVLKLMGLDVPLIMDEPLF
ncbi:2,3-bisphosphoglycerate-independent phosphoglycerate mutase [uncultured Campylobacter sp.]|uniref:2,3-bisphosphoglycerate-independent phosphoglycerate mutase n=1 Tax=uncultured Campylobacter sp. TaxID=218934 RepID=UPI002604178B|nr:2,3-bisphosphoglycerate-independent phosphoglycerate mutase [uncultured Campylobacter sp.]